ncbi:MAG TPA: M23 family metallopeptidase [Chitinophagaceae bacterium]|nr:M23 family metallopeptidase [Chitinophagaceae bacterium]
MSIKKLLFLLLPAAMLCLSCSSSVNKIFGKKTPHEAYSDKVEDSPEGQKWLAVSKKALTIPQTIQLPYRQVGYFHADKPRALALHFAARQGERVNFDLVKKNGADFVIYADLFKQNGTDVSHLLAADTAGSRFGFDMEETGNYILRLQPELYRTGEYSLSASVAPSLGFPVAGNKARTGSFWGDARDAGQRRHEGIDIFAPKLTPAIAATDGRVSRVSEGGIGGKTIWLKAAGRDIHLYYAHLDKQLVQEGQNVKKGDTLGLVGNTGNAKYTPPHLHFGIYTFGGAIDPFPFVNKTIKTAPAFTAKDLTGPLQFKRTWKAKVGRPVNDTSLLVPLAVTAGGYIAEFPDGSIIQTPFTSVKTVRTEKQQAVLATDKPLKSASGS